MTVRVDLWRALKESTVRGECPNCNISTDFKYQGDLHDEGMFIPNYQCDDCGKEFTGPMLEEGDSRLRGRARGVRLEGSLSLFCPNDKCDEGGKPVKKMFWHVGNLRGDMLGREIFPVYKCSKCEGIYALSLLVRKNYRNKRLK